MVFILKKKYKNERKKKILNSLQEGGREGSKSLEQNIICKKYV